MTAYSGTVTKQLSAGDRGQPAFGLGVYALTGALVNGDTITFTNFLANNKPFLLGGSVTAPELDTDATPTAKFKIGDGTTVDLYLLEKGGATVLSNSLAGQLFYDFDGTAITAAAVPASKNIVFTVTAAVATGVASGNLIFKIYGVGV